ncbi:MAG TPA: RHS repeat-associated core domain-containing protein, partial [Thermoanaerobaculia bacterium]|nr:RHS repeat-associated core domain-containing protein [Thermoanaerobaculia bacterium]
SSLTPDPRFGLLSPFSTSKVRTPSGKTRTSSSKQTALLSDPANPRSLLSLTRTTTVNGRTATSTFDVPARRSTETSPALRTRVTTFDATGLPVQTQHGTLAPVTFGYDTRGRLTSIANGSRTMSIGYDSLNRMASSTDSLGRTTGFAYDAADRVTTQTLPDGRVVSFSYDAAGNVTGVTPSSRPVHSFTFNSVDLPSTYAPPAVTPGGTTTYGYDLDHHITSILRPDAKTIAFGYDAAGRLSSVVADSSNYAYVYDGVGNLHSITRGSDALTYTYDGALLTAAAWTGAVQGSVSYQYDNDFRLTGETAAGVPVTYGYDNDGLLTRAGALSLTRDAANGLLTGTTFDAITDSWTYNEFSEPLTYDALQAMDPIFSEHVTRDAAGRIATRTETEYGQSRAYGYTYDDAGRLTDVTVDATNASHYVYDPNGNRLSRTTPPGSESGTYDAQERLLTYGGATYAYGANGELQSKVDTSGTTSYTYDELGNLTHVVLPNGDVIDYVIDGQSRRVGKKVNGTLVRQWLYRSELQIAAELDGAGNLISRFVYGTRSNVPDLMIRDGVTYRILSDHLGSPRVILAPGDTVAAQRITYDEFGNVLSDSNPGFQPFGFAGGLLDQHTRLTRFGARDYDARVGRWTAKDPMGFNGGDTNLYAYVHGDPITFIDPRGTTPQDKWYGHNERPFRDWVHDEKHADGRNDDYDQDEMDEKYEEWVAEGKPDPRRKKGRDKGDSEFCELPQAQTSSNIMNALDRLALKPPNPCILAFGLLGAAVGGVAGTVVPVAGNVAGVAAGFAVGGAIGGAAVGLIGGYIGCR